MVLLVIKSGQSPQSPCIQTVKSVCLGIPQTMTLAPFSAGEYFRFCMLWGLSCRDSAGSSQLAGSCRQHIDEPGHIQVKLYLKKKKVSRAPPAHLAGNCCFRGQAQH